MNDDAQPVLDANDPLDAAEPFDAMKPIDASESDAGEPADADAPDAEPIADASAERDAGEWSDDCIPDRSTGTRSIECQGITFIVAVPAQCASGCGLITDVHGLTMSGEMQNNNTNMRALGEQHGYVVLQPSAEPAPPLSSWDATDDAVIHDFMLRAIRAWEVDEKRVHFTGFSQGGFMSWRFICNHADLLASAAPAAASSDCSMIPNVPIGPMPDISGCTFLGSETPSHEIPILYMHGTMDENYIPFGCAQGQIDPIIAHWGMTDEGVIASDATYTRTRYRSAAGTVLELLAHDYSSSEQVGIITLTRLEGHCYPGSTDLGDEPGQLFSFACEQQASFHWGETAIQFFLDHPKP